MLETRLWELRGQLLKGRVDVGHYRIFTIHDPKERLICCAPFGERVLHHALMNICHPSFERYQLFDSYASRPGKGQYAALDRAECYCRRHRYFLKLDVRRYFYSISHPILAEQLRRRFKDQRLLTIFEDIIASYHDTPGRGLPIGNLTSQYFANHYLAAADRYAIEQLCVPGYVRYMDDMLIWGDDMRQILRWEQRMRTFIASELSLELKPPIINRTSAGVPLLGYVIHPHHLALTRNSRKRFAAKMRRYAQNLQEGCWDEREFVRHAEPLLAFAMHADTLGLRRKILACTSRRVARRARTA